jgi:putative membrane protein
MYRRLTALLALCMVVAWRPLQALAQTQLPGAVQPPPWWGPGPWWAWGDGYGWPLWWICPLMMLFMMVVCAAVFFILRRSWGDGSHRWEASWRGSSHSALEILNERFARGEIDKDEYEERKATILSPARH